MLVCSILSRHGLHRMSITDHTIKIVSVLSETDKAINVRLPNTSTLWIPKSVFSHYSLKKVETVDKQSVSHAFYELYGVKEWFVEKNDLWEYSI